MHLPFFNKKKSHFEYLKNKWSEHNKNLENKLWENHGNVIQSFLNKPRNMAFASLAGMVMMVTNPTSMPATFSAQASSNQYINIDKNTFFLSELRTYLPSEVQPLNSDQEKNITNFLSQNFNLNVTAQIDGIRLDRNYGLIGKEQLLPLFPGDNINSHFKSQEDADKYADSGITPGVGAWGYFSTSEYSLTDDDRMREKYYIAVPTFLAPGYNENVDKYNNFFKYKKMLVVNPDNGYAIVADIADSGPAPFTGKNLGGSPAVMDYLQRVDGAGKGPVLYFFINDPDNKIQLGPINIK